jgi:lysophospholipase L1-like esterase
MQGQTERPAPGRGKRILFAGFIIIICCMFVELTVRVYFSTVVGPHALLYGTPFTRQEVTTAPAAAEDNDGPKTEVKDYLADMQPGEWSDLQSLAGHENVLKGYSKYFPRQSRFDFDVETGERFDVTINNKGFRGRDIVDQKEPGTIRVLTLGASSTLGYFSRDNETYPMYLEALLNERHPGQKIEVINLGIPHLEASNIYALFMNEGVQLDPDIVTFYEGNNDAMHVSDGLWKQSFNRKVLGALGARFMTLALVNTLLGDPFARAQSPAVVYAQADSIARAFVSEIARINEECRKRGILFVASSQQRNSQSINRLKLKGMTYQEELALIDGRMRAAEKMTSQELTFLAHDRLMQQLEAWAAGNNVPFADVVSRLDRDRDVLVSWVHLSPRGNRMVAETFADAIDSSWSARPVQRTVATPGSQP